MSHRTPSTEQISLAAAVGVDVSADTFDIAAARLQDAVASAIGWEAPEPASDRQKTFASSLGKDVAGDSKRVASAKIGEALFDNNQAAIASLALKAGDRVIRAERFEFGGEVQTLEQEFVVSSIQPNGRVFFKGGNGQGAWPTQLRKVVAEPVGRTEI